MSEAVHGRFPKSRRLASPSSYSRVFAQGRSVSAKPFRILYRSNGLDGPRLGLAISRRCAKSAVLRNRLKRTARESFRCAAGALPAVDIVVTCGRAPDIPEPARLRALLARTWDEIRSQSWPSSSSS